MDMSESQRSARKSLARFVEQVDEEEMHEASARLLSPSYQMRTPSRPPMSSLSASEREAQSLCQHLRQELTRVRMELDGARSRSENTEKELQLRRVESDSLQSLRDLVHTEIPGSPSPEEIVSFFKSQLREQKRLQEVLYRCSEMLHEDYDHPMSPSRVTTHLLEEKIASVLERQSELENVAVHNAEEGRTEVDLELQDKLYELQKIHSEELKKMSIQLTDLQERNSQLEQERTSSDDVRIKCNMLGKESSHLREDLVTAKSELNVVRNELKSCSEERQRLANTCGEQKGRIRVLESNVKELNSLHQDWTEQREQFLSTPSHPSETRSAKRSGVWEERARELSSVLEKETMEKNHWKQKSAQLEEVISSLRTEGEMLNVELNEQRQRLSKATQMVDDACANLKQKSEEVSTLRVSCENVKEELSLSNDRRESIRRELDSLRGDYTVLEETTDGLREELSEKNEVIEKCEKINEELSRKLHSIEDKEEHITEIENLLSELQTEKGKWESTKETLEEKLEELERKNSEISVQLRIAENRNSELQKSCTEYQVISDQSKYEVKSLVDDLSSIHEKEISERNQLSKLLAKQNSLEEENKSLKSKIISLKENIVSSDDLNSRLLEANADLSSQTDANKSLRGRLETVAKEAEECKNQLHLSRTEIVKLQRNIAESTDATDVHNLEEELKELKEDLLENKRQSEAARSQYRKEKSSLHSKCLTLEEQLSDVQSRFHGSKEGYQLVLAENQRLTENLRNSFDALSKLRVNVDIIPILREREKELLAELRFWKEKGEKLDEENHSLRVSLGTVNQKLTLCEAHKEEMEAKGKDTVESLQEELASSERERERLLSEKDRVQTDLVSASERVRLLSGKLEESEVSLQKLKRKFSEERSKETDERELRVKRAQSEANERKADVENIREALNSCIRERDGLREVCGQLENEITVLRTETSSLQTDLRLAKEKNSILQESNDEIQKEMEEQFISIDVHKILVDEMNSLKEDVEMRRLETHKLEGIITEHETKGQAMSKVLRDERESSALREKELTTIVVQLREEISSLNSHKNELSSALEELENDAELQRTMIQTQGMELTDIKDERDRVGGNCSTLQAQYEHLESKYKKSEREINRLRESQTELSEALDKTTETLRIKETTLEEITEQLHSEKLMSTNLRENQESLLKTMSNIEEENSAAQSSLEKVDVMFNKMMDYVDESDSCRDSIRECVWKMQNEQEESSDDTQKVILKEKRRIEEELVSFRSWQSEISSSIEANIRAVLSHVQQELVQMQQRNVELEGKVIYYKNLMDESRKLKEDSNEEMKIALETVKKDSKERIERLEASESSLRLAYQNEESARKSLESKCEEITLEAEQKISSQEEEWMRQKGLCEEEIRQLRESKEDLEEIVSRNEKKIEELTENNRVTQREHSITSSTLERNEEVVDSLRGERDGLNRELNSLRAKLYGMNGKNAELKTQLDFSLSEKTDLEREVGNIQMLLKEKEKSLERMQQEETTAASISVDHEMQISGLQAQNSALKKDITALTLRIESLRSSEEKTQSEKTELRKQNGVSQQQVSQLKSVLQNSERKYSSDIRQLQQKSEMDESMAKTSYDALEAELSDVRSGLIDAREEIRRKEEHYRDLNRQYEEILAENESLRFSLGRIEREQEVMKSEIQVSKEGRLVMEDKHNELLRVSVQEVEQSSEIVKEVQERLRTKERELLEKKKLCEELERTVKRVSSTLEHERTRAIFFERELEEAKLSLQKEKERIAAERSVSRIVEAPTKSIPIPEIEVSSSTSEYESVRQMLDQTSNRLEEEEMKRASLESELGRQSELLRSIGGTIRRGVEISKKRTIPELQVLASRIGQIGGIHASPLSYSQLKK